MDPRQPPQHPYPRNSSSQYGRSPFPSTSSQSSYPPSAHPPNTPTFSDHHRRPSDTAYYNQQRGYPPESQSMPATGHSRHASVSSVGHGTPGPRGMPPPSSPQQPAQQPHHNYGPAPRPPSLSGPSGPPSAFPTHRDLPSLPPLSRASSAAAMSISSMLGGPPSATSTHFTSLVGTNAPPNSAYTSSHASPRIGQSSADYAPFRRPQTPEYSTSYESWDRANSAGSPPGGAAPRFATPEARRYGTPQAYSHRPMQGPNGLFADDRRDSQQGRGVPPRPSSQPNGYYMPASRAPERIPNHNDLMYSRRSEGPRELQNDSMFGRRGEAVPRETLHRAENIAEQRYQEEQLAARLYAERDRQDREAAHRSMLREREQQERALAERRASLQGEYAHQVALQAAYARATEPREPPQAWRGPGYDAQQPRYEQQNERPPQQPPPQSTASFEHPPSSAAQYPSNAAPISDPRYPPSSSATMPQHAPMHVTPYEASIIERQRLAQQAQLQQQQVQQQQGGYSSGPTSHPQYQPHESPNKRPIEEAPPMQQQRNLLGVGELNRKGRSSPLPQAVQGAQIQQAGPAGEPHIKNEFGRMFSGIGSGVGSAMGVPSLVSANAQGMPFSNPNQLRRENPENLTQQDSPTDGHKIPRESSRGGRRKKLMDDELRNDDDSSTGRNTPSGRGKRVKTHHHHHNHHHHHYHQQENTSSPSQANSTPFKNVKGSHIPSPPSQDRESQNIPHHHIRTHHHHPHSVPPKSAPPQNTVIPLPKLTVRSQAVLDAVAHLPRSHLGHAYYQSCLKPNRHYSPGQSGFRRGFASTPQALPKFEGHQNCTFTIKVPRVHLAPPSREEITSRRAVWGTDVYTDDSDVIAACIHQGWFRGEWSEDVDVDLLGLDLEPSPSSAKAKPSSNGVTGDEILTNPPARGPMHVPPHRDSHITVLILPPLQKYASTTRFGIKSREWGGDRSNAGSEAHDGLSFMIVSVQWVNGVDGVEARSGGKRRVMLSKELEDVEEEWSDGVLRNGNGNGGVVVEESFERGLVGERGGITGVGLKSWWKKPSNAAA